MPTNVTVLQLSDLHIGSHESALSYTQDIVREKILDDCLKMAESLGPPDLIFITGDISYSGDPTDEFWQAAEWITRLCEHIKTGRDRLFVVPGNHDVNRKAFDPSLTEDLRNELHADPALLDSYLGDRAKAERYFWPQLKSYAQFSSAVSATPVSDALQPFWEHCVHSALGPLRVFGLNSALLSFGSEVQGLLRLGKRQLRYFVDAQARDDLHLVLVHHPPSWLSDGKEFMDQLAQRPHLLFCGHLHQPSAESTLPFGSPGRLVFSAGAAGLPGGDRGGHAYSWIRITPVRIEYYPRIWTASGRFVADPQGCDEKSECASRELAALPSPLANWLNRQRVDAPPTIRLSSATDSGNGMTVDSREIDGLCAAASGNMISAVDLKRLLGEALLCEIPSPEGSSVYFGPGTTVFHAFRNLWENAETWFFDCKVATSNDWILGFLRAKRAWLANRIELVGRFFVREYGSWVLPEKSSLPIEIDIAIVGLAGLGLAGNDLELRTCWQDQVRTIRLASIGSKRRSIFVADDRKLITTQGSTFVRASDFRASSPGKRYDLLIARKTSESTTPACAFLDRAVGKHTLICKDRVMRWSWDAMKRIPKGGMAA